VRVRGLIFVGDRCRDHSSSSGYDQLCTVFPDAGWLSGRQLCAGRLAWIRPPAGSDGPGSVFHVLYGDCSGSALPAILRARWPRATIVSTVHQPIDRLTKDEAGLRALDAVDAIITVSREQASQLANLSLTASLHALPHGVWTTVFRPESGPAQSDRKEILIVGTYLRDWRLARRVVGTLARAGVRSRVLGVSASEQLAVDHPLVTVTPRVSEAELVQLYDRSAALFLPVVGATASNALLEAMAVGCPVVCTRFPPLVEEYLGDDSDAFAPQEEDRAVDLLLHYVADPARRNARSPTLIRRAQAFDWSRLRAQYAQTYQAILARARSTRTSGALRSSPGRDAVEAAVRSAQRRAFG
jgi:glycosyltransferase involved in cell wall biosynthesis